MQESHLTRTCGWRTNEARVIFWRYCNNVAHADTGIDGGARIQCLCPGTGRRKCGNRWSGNGSGGCGHCQRQNNGDAKEHIRCTRRNDGLWWPVQHNIAPSVDLHGYGGSDRVQEVRSGHRYARRPGSGHGHPSGGRRDDPGSHGGSVGRAGEHGLPVLGQVIESRAWSTCL